MYRISKIYDACPGPEFEMSNGGDEIEEFEDSEGPGVYPEEVEVADEEEIKFLDGLSELATLESGETR